MLRKILFTLLLLFISVLSSLGQDKALEMANYKYDQYSFVPAIDIYKKVLDKGFVSDDLLKKLGNSYYFNADYKEAANIYKRLLAEYNSEVTPDYYFRYVQCLRSLGEYDLAQEVMIKFADVISKNDTVKDFNYDQNYLEEIKKNSGRCKVAPFEYNTIYSEFAPTFYKNGLIFSSDRDTGNLARYRHSWNSKDFLDLYKIHADSSSENKVVKLQNPINTRWHESTSVVTKDGSTLYFTRNNYRDGKLLKDDKGVVGLKIFQAQLENEEYTVVTELPFNSDDYSVAHPALSPDEKTLYFVSDMPGTLGESDLFKVQINEDGTFSNPENLGTAVNTNARETFPFISREGVLYFSSDGHLGLGGLDIFAIKLINIAQRSAVKNLGEPINSKLDDFTFIFDDTTKFGYFASNRENGLGNDDIYSFVENIPLVLDCQQEITGTVRDKISNQVLVGATIKAIDEYNLEISETLTDAEGKYKIIIDCNKGNFVRAMIDGYIPAEEYMTTSNGEPQIIDFYLERKVVNAGFGDDLAKILQLSTIYFDLNKYNIRPDAEVEIQQVIAAMEKYPSLRIRVNSHTDSRGLDSYNLWLSEKRAESTIGYMVSKGIPADRLKGEGFGETKLVNNCDNFVKCTSKQHDVNRRSEFIIVE